jgi:hypothetical protein
LPAENCNGYYTHLGPTIIKPIDDILHNKSIHLLSICFLDICVFITSYSHNSFLSGCSSTTNVAVLFIIEIQHYIFPPSSDLLVVFKIFTSFLINHRMRGVGLGIGTSLFSVMNSFHGRTSLTAILIKKLKPPDILRRDDV